METMVLLILFSINVQILLVNLQEQIRLKFTGFCLHFASDIVLTSRIKYSTLDVFLNLVCVLVQVWWRSRRGSWRRSSWTCRVKRWPESHLPGSHTSSRWLSSPQRKRLSTRGALNTLLTADGDRAHCSIFQIARVFQLQPDGRLEQTVSMATDNQALMQHLHITYRRASWPDRHVARRNTPVK